MAKNLPDETSGKKSGKTEVENDAWTDVRRASSSFAATILVCVAIGWYVDEKFGIRPWGLVAMSFFGFAIAIANIWYALEGKKTSAQTGKETKKDEEGQAR